MVSCLITTSLASRKEQRVLVAQIQSCAEIRQWATHGAKPKWMSFQVLATSAPLVVLPTSRHVISLRTTAVECSSRVLRRVLRRMRSVIAHWEQIQRCVDTTAQCHGVSGQATIALSLAMALKYNVLPKIITTVQVNG